MSEKKYILLIDDEPDMRTALSEFIEEEGYLVAQAENGLRGLEYLRHNPEPCLILLDYMMPVMGGEEFCHQLKSDPILKKIPVVLMTAAIITPEKLELMKLEAFIPKPLHIGNLLGVIGQYCQKS